MTVTGTVTKTVRRVKPHGSVYLTVYVARENTHDIPLTFLWHGEQRPAKGQTVTIEGMPMMDSRSPANVGAAKLTIHPEASDA